MNYSQVILTLFLFVPRIKGDPRLSSYIPFDLTVVFGLALYVAIAVRLKQFDWSTLPRVLWLYLPFIFLMILSITYTPLPSAGIEKTARFILLTGLGIIAPFFVLNTPSRMYQHFVLLTVLYFLLTLEPLSQMGTPITDDGDGRLITIGGTTIELGTSAVFGITTILYMILPRLDKVLNYGRYYFNKILLYLVIVVFFAALIGAGARSATISLIVVVLLNAFFYSRQRMDISLAACLTASMLLFIDIPEKSLEYLGTLIESDTGALMNWRGHLMNRGLELIVENPIFGVGIGGFPHYGNIPPPAPWYLYNWPHNGIIEIGCEMGLVAAMIASLLIILSFIETFKQLADEGFAYKIYSKMNFALLTIGFLTFMNTGDINDLRSMWFYMSLPFVVRGFGRNMDRDVKAHVV